MDRETKVGASVEAVGKMAEAHREGMLAYTHGKTVFENPHEPMAIEWFIWRTGFVDAASASMED